MATCFNCLHTYQKNCFLVLIRMPEYPLFGNTTPPDKAYYTGARYAYDVNTGWTVEKEGEQNWKQILQQHPDSDENMEMREFRPS